MNISHLEGERVRLREWLPNEIDGVHRWVGNPVVNRFLSFATSSREASAAHLQDIITGQQADPRTEYFLAIEHIEAGVTIGDAGFTWIEKDVAEIGYFLEPGYWGAGYATEAAGLIIDLAKSLGATRIVATCHKDNNASEKVMLRLGMQPAEAAKPDQLVYAMAL